MTVRLFGALVASYLAWLSTAALGAASAQAVFPLVRASVPSGETRVFTARFFDALGRPAAGETVEFSNDACGRFPNGQFIATTTTDATGTASITFTALPIGGTFCWLVARAGASVTFNVLVFPLSTAYVTARLDPAEPSPGQQFRVITGAHVGQYDIFDADISARIVPGTATATLSTASVSTGTSGSNAFVVTPGKSLGDYNIELTYRGSVKRTVAMRAPVNPWQDLWWSGEAESGWGMSVVQHRDMLFSIVYAYDNAGKPIWYVMPSGTWNDARTAFSGAVYVPKGSPFNAYDTARFDIGAPVGTLTLTFNSLANEATLDYTINGLSGSKPITRILFGEGGAARRPGVGDLWWGGMSQNGWGLSVLQQGDTLFTLWFTYDAAGAATWYVMPGGYWGDSRTYSGRLYRSMGSTWLDRPYDRSAFRMIDVGSYSLRFAADGTATFTYYMDSGPTATLPLTRIPF
jgi:hypothetical protein